VSDGPFGARFDFDFFQFFVVLTPILRRTKEDLPEELIFHCNYLGGDLPNFALNFSRPGNQVIVQYYNFLRLGFEGYERVQRCSSLIAQHLAKHIDDFEEFECISHGRDIPVFAFKVTDKANFSVYDLSDKLREKGFLLPAYTFPANREDLAVLRVVCKEGFSRDLSDMLLQSIKSAVDFFAAKKCHEPQESGKTFHH
jgi:glutamate decarboxylase